MAAFLYRCVREPLVHFFVAGAAVFALWSGTSDRAAPKDDRIVVTSATIETLAENWTRTRQRPPTTEELDGLIEDHVREEVMYRQALALGLDRDDTIIRRRLRQKMEFVSEDVAAHATPTEPQLRQYLAEHADAFRLDPAFTFTHVFLSPSRRGDRLDADARHLLALLNGPAGTRHAEEAGDPFLLPAELVASPSGDIARMFGNEFADAMSRLEPGRWHGPIRSGYGAHLVLVRDRIPGRIPALEEVRTAVARQWQANARREANDAFYARLRSRFTVSIQRPNTAAGMSTGTTARVQH